MRGICYGISRVKIGAEFKKTSNQDCLVRIFNFNSIFLNCMCRHFIKKRPLAVTYNYSFTNTETSLRLRPDVFRFLSS